MFSPKQYFLGHQNTSRSIVFSTSMIEGFGAAHMKSVLYPSVADYLILILARWAIFISTDLPICQNTILLWYWWSVTPAKSKQSLNTSLGCRLLSHCFYHFCRRRSWVYSGSRSLWKETRGFCEQQLILHHVTIADKLGWLYYRTGRLFRLCWEPCLPTHSSTLMWQVIEALWLSWFSPRHTGVLCAHLPHLLVLTPFIGLGFPPFSTAQFVVNGEVKQSEIGLG